MLFSTQRMFILLICIIFLSIQPAEVSSLRSIHLVLRHSKEDHGVVLRNLHMLKVEKQTVNTEKKQAPAKKTSNPYRSSKRRVRKGSDPIHNRS
ncbi:hypothetical protein NMG60_11036270 [Bertholletia excelsa]